MLKFKWRVYTNEDTRAYPRVYVGLKFGKGKVLTLKYKPKHFYAFKEELAITWCG